MLAKEFEAGFNCLGANIEQYKTFPFPLEKKKFKGLINIEKQMKKNISCKLQIIDSTKSIASLLSNLVDTLPDGINKIKFKNEHDNKKCKACGIRYKDCKCYLEYTRV